MFDRVIFGLAVSAGAILVYIAYLFHVGVVVR